MRREGCAEFASLQTLTSPNFFLCAASVLPPSSVLRPPSSWVGLGRDDIPNELNSCQRQRSAFLFFAGTTTTTTTIVGERGEVKQS